MRQTLFWKLCGLFFLLGFFTVIAIPHLTGCGGDNMQARAPVSGGVADVPQSINVSETTEKKDLQKKSVENVIGLSVAGGIMLYYFSPLSLIGTFLFLGVVWFVSGLFLIFALPILEIGIGLIVAGLATLLIIRLFFWEAAQRQIQRLK